MKAKQDRDYSNLQETERVRYAVKRAGTNVKDYSMKYIVEVIYNASEDLKQRGIAVIKVGPMSSTVSALQLIGTVNEWVDDEDENGVIPRRFKQLDTYGNAPVSISSKQVNYESLRDHLAELTVADITVLVDLEELLKALRYV